jgi:hypothetical protein
MLTGATLPAVNGPREMLEATLRDRVTRETLAVWADVLQIEGDPRGALITQELAHADPSRFELLETWVRAELAHRSGKVAIPHLVVTGVRDAGWLESPLGDFVRVVSVMARIDEVRRVVDRLATRPRPWLRRMNLFAGMATLRLGPELVHATPNLEELVLEGSGAEHDSATHIGKHVLAEGAGTDPDAMVWIG